MKLMFKTVLSAGIFLLSSVILNAQLTPDEAVEQMGRGINLGNTLDAPNYEGEWAPAAEEWYFDMYKDAGFSSVRIPITWNARVSGELPYTVDPDFFKRLDTIINWALDREMIVIINAHHEDWFKDHYSDPATRDRFDSIWSQISIRYKDMPETLFFEMINEPRAETTGLTVEEINETNARLMNIIRKHNPTRMVVYSGRGWTSSTDMMQAAIPDDPYIMAYFHSYDPWSFAGEGNGTWGSTSQRNSLHNLISTAATWGEENGVRVLLGEFGAHEDCDYNSRMIHYATYVDACLQYGVAFTVWDDGGWFEVLNREDSTWLDSKDILIHRTLMSPDEIAVEEYNDSSFLVSWTPRSDLYDTILVEKRSEGGDFEIIGGVNWETTSYVDTMPKVGVICEYRVIALTDTLEHYSYPVRAIKQAWLRYPYHLAAIPVPGTVEAEDFDFGGENLTYHDLDIVNFIGDYRPDEGVDIDETSTGIFMVYAEGGEWLEYSVDVESEGEYLLRIYVGTRKPGGRLRVNVGGHITPYLDLPVSGSYNRTELVEAQLHLGEGEQMMRILSFGDEAFNIDRVDFTNITGVSEMESATGIRLYPNPARESLQVDLDREVHSGYVQLFSADGRVIRTLSFAGKQVRLDLSGLDSGLYLVQVQCDGFILDAPFLKQ